MRSFPTVLLFLLVGVTGGIMGAYRVSTWRRPSLPSYGKAPDFSLLDSSERKIDSAALEGKVWVLNFFFTSCGSVCPAIVANVAKLYREHRSRSDLRFVSVTVDPERDTPAVLAEYASRFQASPDRWHFLTGPKADIDRLAAELKLGMGPEPDMHNTRLVLVDGQSTVRGYYDGNDPEALEKLNGDIAALVDEAGK